MLSRIVLVISLALVPLFYVLDSLLPTQYIFDPADLQAISQLALAQNQNWTEPEPLLRKITQELRAKYGDAIGDWSKEDWLFNNAGGAMGTMVLLHTSFTEYLILFGTPLQTEGHSGVHLADDYFTILWGEQHAAYPGDLVPTIYKPGMQNHLKRGDAIQYSMPIKGGCFALELAQGWIPAMMPFGFADTFSSTLDWWNLWKTVKLTSLGMGKQLLRGKL